MNMNILLTADAQTAGGGIIMIAYIVLIVGFMYFFMIRPQKKKDKQIQDMRKSLQVGDEIITIGGICGKIVKTKPDTIVIQVGADRVKFEMMRWAVSSVTKASPRRDTVDEVKEEEPKKVMPKRLRKSSEVEEMEAQEIPAAGKTEDGTMIYANCTVKQYEQIIVNETTGLFYMFDDDDKIRIVVE